MRRIVAITVGRSDFGIYRPVFESIEAHDDLELGLIASGMHLSPEFGNTIEEVEASEFELLETVEMALNSDRQTSLAKSMGLGTILFSDALRRARPDIVLVLGDRFEMFAACVAAVPLQIPMAHIHGGELTLGAIDDVFRHSMTKMSHLHFAATEEYGRRIRQMGEESWRVTVAGAPGLDNIQVVEPMSVDELNEARDLQVEDGFLLATFHPVTTAPEEVREHTSELLDALADSGRQVLFTAANADTGGQLVNAMIRKRAARQEEFFFVEHLGTRPYLSAMQHASAMVGNSSSGIIEAASFELPAVNIGTRQQGRARGPNVIEASPERSSILSAIRTATSDEFKASLAGMKNMYGDGNSGVRIADVLANSPSREKLLAKKFVDWTDLESRQHRNLK